MKFCNKKKNDDPEFLYILEAINRQTKKSSFWSDLGVFFLFAGLFYVGMVFLMSV